MQPDFDEGHDADIHFGWLSPGRAQNAIGFPEGDYRKCVRALILDFDGALGRSSATRERAEPDPELLPVLHRIKNRTDTRVVIVTGRSAFGIPDSAGPQKR